MSKTIHSWVFRFDHPTEEVVLTEVLRKFRITWRKSGQNAIVVRQDEIRGREGAEEELRALVGREMVKMTPMAV